jgi:hypothetical protein
MANSSLAVVVDGIDALTLRSRIDRDAMSAVMEYIDGLSQGSLRGVAKIYADGAAAKYAYGTLVLSSGSGAVGGTINGVTVTDTWATNDINSAGLVAVAINASTNALVQYFVTASNIAGTAALASVAAGTKFGFDGIEFTAVANDTARPHQFAISGSNTADAAALVTAMVAMPYLNDKYIITSSSGTVTIAQRSGGATVGTHQKMFASATTFTLTQLAATATCYLSALQAGIWGNVLTLVASGTGVTASGARLTGGTGLNVNPITVYR